MSALNVLMPVRNGVGTVGAAVRSTLRALPADADLHVLDDGSDDGTGEELRRIRDRRLAVHRSEEPSGVARGLNSLLEATDAELVARMDADDLVLPGRFSRSLRGLAGADLVFTTVVEWTPQRRRIRPRPPIGLSVGAFPLQLLLTNPVAHPTMLARRAVVERLGGYREVPAEDYDLWLRAAASGARLRRLALPGILYRLHDAQVTASTAWRLDSWRNPLVAESFAVLAERLLGARFRRLNALALDAETDAGFEAELGEFATAIRSAGARLPTTERRRLLRALEGRLAAVRSLRRSRP